MAEFESGSFLNELFSVVDKTISILKMEMSSCAHPLQSQIAGDFYTQSPICFRRFPIRTAPFLPMFNKGIENKFSR